MFLKSPPTELSQKSSGKNSNYSRSERASKKRSTKEDNSKTPKKKTISPSKKKKGPGSEITLTPAAKKLLRRKNTINLNSNKGYQTYVNCTGTSVDLTGCSKFIFNFRSGGRRDRIAL